MVISPRRSIARQLALALSLVLIVVIAGSCLFALHALSVSIEGTQRKHLGSEARLLSDQQQTFLSTLKISTQRLANLFERRFDGGLSLAGERLPLGSATAPALLFAGQALNSDFSQVDDFTRLTGGVATIFVRDGDDFTRITTSLKKQDGSRAIGTQLDRKHPAYAGLLQGQNYVGRAQLFGRSYMTQYTPVRDGAGKVIAVLFVGFDYTDAQAQQMAQLTQLRIGETGSLALLDEQGNWLVPPANAKQANELLAALKNDPKQHEHTWQDGNEDFLSVSAPVAGEGWTVVATLPKAELDAPVHAVGLRLAIGSLIALVLAVLASVVLLRHKLKPLGQLVERAQALGRGQLSVRVEARSHDEIGELARSFNQMADALASTVEQVRGSSRAVTERSQQLSQLSDQTLRRSAEQSSQIDSMASAVEEFSATAQNIADGMQRTERLVQENAQQTRTGTQAMQGASGALEQIADSLASTAELIKGLDGRSQQIGGIIGVISGIAEQTNLLALNAAIEAARAGEQGRGFAVVADEVRQLAGRTSEATREISQMIGAVQGETQRAMGAIDEGNRLMEQGLARNADVAQALRSIDQQVAEAVEQFSGIAQATAEQSTTATALSRNIQAIAVDNAAQRDAAEVLAGTAGELRHLAEDLSAEVGRFS
ncbi:methyl-accepting chemotaxis protein [Pseudomonas sp. HR1]|jgi:methyl-accepting chemotaxis protein|uniref:methyl-accepting chemotaxis protein n=1 Tax=Pseudomonadaceae TaxID=135621 RepID=UPI0005699729|nr:MULTISPECIES: methyl-accepting chemotaxis protein [Pseudomonas]MBA1260147.1 methyl-accepting chemotaxis protein [Pseudomonas psychrotolerans]MBH3332194.1 methyl-accepting chemotaxis protein [Pseudomonas oryzihabitans]MDK4198811.1 methyl-accepting chemotaxis protein [Pseudomonas sp. HR1]MDU4056373.1 methyl-accepting chemotaxis protein [Pseudomonas oryzihabitans]NMZ45491.1 methyl-accepting chemotaxis protein [Pseudomonas oryzihabitans]